MISVEILYLNILIRLLRNPSLLKKAKLSSLSLVSSIQSHCVLKIRPL